MRLLLLSILLAAGCGTPPTEPPTNPAAPADTLDLSGPVTPFADEDDYRRQRGATQTALETAIGRAEASTIESCRVVPTSEQACGGATTFAVYSADDPLASQVERLARRLVALDEAANAQFEWASTCMAYEPPTPVLRDGRCADPSR